MAYPGWWSLFPTLGAVCIIQAGNLSYINSKILSTKLMVFIGKISYSLYLWHWPILVLFRMMYPSGSSSILSYTLPLIALSVILSIASYFFIENTVRYSRKKYISILLLIGLILLSVPAFYWKNNYWKIF